MTFGQLSVPWGLKNPTQITAGENHTCAFTEEGVICWGKNNSGQLDTPDHLIFKVNIYKMNFYFKEIARVLYRGKSHFLKRISKKPIEHSEQLLLFNFYAFGSFFKEVQSEIFHNEVLKDYRRAQQFISRKFLVNQLSDIRCSSKTIKHSLWVLGQVLSSTRRLVSPEAKRSIDILLPLLGDLLSRDSISQSQAKTFVVHLNKQKRLFRDLNQNESYSPYYALMKKINAWIMEGVEQ